MPVRLVVVIDDRDYQCLRTILFCTNETNEPFRVLNSIHEFRLCVNLFFRRHTFNLNRPQCGSTIVRITEQQLW